MTNFMLPSLELPEGDPHSAYSEGNPVIIEGTLNLLRTSLTSILWVWPLRNSSHPAGSVRSRLKRDRPDASSVW